MALKILTPDDVTKLERGDTAVCIPLYGGHDVFVECLRSVLEHTPLDVPVMVCDDAGPDGRSLRHLQSLSDAGALRREVHYLRHPQNGGFVANVNDAFSRFAPADVVVVNSDCIVSEGWLEALRRAAASDTLVATVSVFTNHGTILSLPDRNRSVGQLPQSVTGDVVADEVARVSLGLHPRIPTLVGHCFLVTRAALDLVGEFDLAFSPGYGEEVDFAQRCALHGLVHVVADDTFVVHHGSSSFASHPAREALQRANDLAIGVRYPYYYDWVRETELDESGPFPRALHAAQRAFQKLSVAIDGRCLTPVVTGTQVACLELIVALARRDEVDVRVVVPGDLGEYARTILQQHPVTILPVDAVHAGGARADIVHRPFQVSSAEDLGMLALMGRAVVITHLDLIGFNNPGYFRSYEDWAAYRRLARQSLALADGVVFISRTAADEAVAQELLPRDRAHVVHLGTDHALGDLPAKNRPPSRAHRLSGRPFLLCLGTDFRHKNRLFALRLLRSLRTQGWDGDLVFAGAHVAIGSSASDEAAYLTRHPDLGSHVTDVAAVDEGEKRWLLGAATMMVYPSVHEGFGFVPFEAAEAGLATIFAAQTSLAELLPSSLALIEKWDPDETARRVLPLLASSERREEHVTAVRAAGAPLTWVRAGAGLGDVYRTVATRPTREARRIAESFAIERAAGQRLQDRCEDLERRLAEMRPMLDTVEEQLLASVPRDLRRPLLALTGRPWLRDPLLRLIGGVYRLGYRVTHLGSAPRG